MSIWSWLFDLPGGAYEHANRCVRRLPMCDSTTTCPSCGATDFSRQHRAGYRRYWFDSYGDDGWTTIGPPHLLVTCLACGWTTDEALKNAPDTLAPNLEGATILP